MNELWTDANVRRSLGVANPSTHADGAPVFTGVSTDTRTLKPGELFVALRGARFDAHAHLDEAARAGARGAVVDLEDKHVRPTQLTLYPVADTLVALGRLARLKRRALGARVVGITGSSGKTTTKDLLAGATSSTLKTHSTPGNLNNRVGLPLTLFGAPDDSELLVLEMGTNEPGEIAALAEIAEPDVAVVTTVSETHLEGLGSLEGVLAEKLSLVGALAGDAPAFVGDSPPVLAERARLIHQPVRVAGLTERADSDLTPKALRLGERGCFSFEWRGEPVQLRIPGDGPTTDAMLALGVAESLGVPAADAARGVSAVEPGDMRGEVRVVSGRTLLVDCYNANPESVSSAARTLATMSGTRRVAILGSMLELGVDSDVLHGRVLREVLGLGLDQVVLLGAFAAAADTVNDPRVVVVADVSEAGAYLATETRPDDVVLLKASRGVRLERALEALTDQVGEPN